MEVFLVAEQLINGRMNMAKATHNGICQACNKAHAYNEKTGNISKHGYTVENGWFEGTCMGADNNPLQHERTIADQTVIYLQDLASKLSKQNALGVDGIKEVTISVYQSSPTYGYVKEKRTKETHEKKYGSWETCQKFELMKNIANQELLAKMAQDVKETADKIFGTKLLKRA